MSELLFYTKESFLSPYYSPPPHPRRVEQCIRHVSLSTLLKQLNKRKHRPSWNACQWTQIVALLRLRLKCFWSRFPEAQRFIFWELVVYCTKCGKAQQCFIIAHNSFYSVHVTGTWGHGEFICELYSITRKIHYDFVRSFKSRIRHCFSAQYSINKLWNFINYPPQKDLYIKLLRSSDTVLTL